MHIRTGAAIDLTPDVPLGLGARPPAITISLAPGDRLLLYTDGLLEARSPGKPPGFPRFKSRHRTTPAFRLRAKYGEGQTPPVRPAGPKQLRVPKLGGLKVREGTRQLRRMLEQGRFHVYAAAFRFAHGRWTVAVTGVAAALHPARRRPAGRHQRRVGVDLGVKTLAVAADETGTLRHEWKGV